MHFDLTFRRSFFVALHLCMAVVSLVQADQSQGQLVFQYDGTPYTVKDLTGLSFADVHENLKELAEREYWQDSMPDKIGVSLTPATTSWGDRGKPTPSGVYTHMINGVIVQFIRARAFETLIKQHALPDSPWGKLENISQLAQPRVFRFHERSISGHRHRAKYLSQPELPAKLHELPDSIRPRHPMDTMIIAVRELRRTCIPYMVNAQSVQWADDYFLQRAIKYYVSDLVLTDKEKFVFEMEALHGDYELILAYGYEAEHEDDLTKLVESLPFNNRILLGNALLAANRSYARKGVRIRLETDRGRRPFVLDKLYRLADTNFQPRKWFLPPVEEHETQFAIYGIVEVGKLSDYSLAHHASLVDFSTRYFLKPIVETLLQKLEVDPAYEFPEVKIILGRISNNGFEKVTGRHSVDLPTMESLTSSGQEPVEN